MKLEQARSLTKYFGMGVSAEIWCYADNGNWRIKVSHGDSETTFYNVDDLRRTVAQIKLALDHVQSVSDEDCWKDIPSDVFAAVETHKEKP